MMTETDRPRIHSLEMFSKQRDFVFLAKPYCAFVGGVGSGKTRAGVYKDLKYCIDYPGAFGMVTAPTFPMLRDATLRTMQEVYPKDIYEFNRSDMTIKFKNGSEILLRSTEDPDHLRGPNLAFVHMDEAAQSSKESWLIIQGRLRQVGYPHQAWITTTPQGINWVYDEFADHPKPDYALIVCSSRDNPYLTPDFIRKLEESYDYDFALQEIEGRFLIIGGKSFFMLETITDARRDIAEPIEIRQGSVRIWSKVSKLGRYVAGADLAWGESHAYSCLSILDYQTGELVAELHGRLKQEEVASASVALCREYNNAFLGVENNSEGKAIVELMTKLGYDSHMYYQDWESKHPDRPGWHTDATTRPLMLAEFEEAARNRRVRIHCADAIAEMQTFVRSNNGKPEPTPGKYSDHIMSLAIAWQMRKYAKFGLRAGQRGVPIPYSWG